MGEVEKQWHSLPHWDEKHVAEDYIKQKINKKTKMHMEEKSVS